MGKHMVISLKNTLIQDQVKSELDKKNCSLLFSIIISFALIKLYLMSSEDQTALECGNLL